MNGRKARALVDSGCTDTMVRAKLLDSWFGQSSMTAFDGTRVQCMGLSEPTISIHGNNFNQRVKVVGKIVANIDVVLGMDIIAQLGGMVVDSHGKVTFGPNLCAAVIDFDGNPNDYPLKIDDKDFSAVFDGLCLCIWW